MIKAKKETLTNEIEDKVIETLKKYSATKTGYFSLFTGVKDFKIDEVELLQFLLANCPETIEILEQVCEQYRTEFKKSTSVSHYLKLTSFALDKIYDFPFVSPKFEIIPDEDKVSSISQVIMKERHTTYLNILREFDVEIEGAFIETFNKIPARMNPWRVEQTFSHLRCVMQNKGMKLNYSDYTKANPHVEAGQDLPYIHPNHYNYYIIDNLGGYGGQICLCRKDFEKNSGFEWGYMSCKWANRGHENKDLAYAQIEEMKELNKTAQIQGLEWHVEYLNRIDIVDIFHTLSKHDQIVQGEYYHLNNDVPEGFINKHRQFSREVNKKYKEICKAITEAIQGKRLGVAI